MTLRRQNFLPLLILFFLASCTNKNSTEFAPAEYVNCFVGTDGPGNTYPGVALPFGMVQLSPDNGLPGWDRIAGYYWPDSTIAGFSHKHLTGTGAGDLYDILVMPLNSRFSGDLWPDRIDYRPYSLFSHAKEKAFPGYYAVELLSSGISAELTATSRVGMHRYSFPDDDSSHILVDLGYALNWDSPVETFLKMEDQFTLSGYRFSTGWARDQREYFVIKLSHPVHCTVLYNDNNAVKADEVKGQKTKAMLYFSGKESKQVMLKVAVSSHSVEGARKNMEAELPGWDFDATVEDAREVWNKQLSSITIEGTEAQKKLFYTNLYHCFLTPSLHSDVDGWYKGADCNYHQAVGYNKYETFSLWDTYRTAHPLYSMIAVPETEDFIKSFLSHFDETGALPVWSMAGNETNMMIGYHAVPVIVDAFFKGIAMDTLKAYEACKATAMSDRWDLPEYRQLGYVPADGRNNGNWSVSITLEYSFNDWCIAQFAKALGLDADYQYFLKRSENWKNLFDPQTHFFRPKNINGEFVQSFNPKEYTEYFCESNAWQYFFAIHHDIEALCDTMGRERFLARLDSMFTFESDSTEKLPIFSTGMIGQYAHGNEPSHHVAWLYSMFGQPEKTSKLIVQIIESQYSIEPNGYCGNEDCGQMSAWLIMSSLGMYPVNPCGGDYYLARPWIAKATIQLSNGNKLTIIRGNGKNKESVFESPKGKTLVGNRINHKQLLQGGTLIIE